VSCSAVPQSAMPNFRAGEPHIWFFGLAAPPSGLAQAAAFLTADEIERASRYRFSDHRRRFMVARAHLRCLLASYLDTVPANIHLQYNVHGRPSLASNAVDLDFNVAHTHELMAVAVCWRRRVGIDIERRYVDPSIIAETTGAWSEAERAMIGCSPSEAKPDRLLSLWTRKEAILKGDGRGILYPPHQLDLSDTFGRSPPFSYHNSDLSPPHWTLWDIKSLSSQYHGTLAVEGYSVVEPRFTALRHAFGDGAFESGLSSMLYIHLSPN
jgi:4'-phosphopantetheinyl transferase